MFYFALEQLNKINSVSTLYPSAQDCPVIDYLPCWV